jgi:hypothetical protein
MQYFTPSHKNLPSLWRTYVALPWFLALALMGLPSFAADPPQTARGDGFPPIADLSVAEIVPKHDGISYCGRFNMKNRGKGAIDVYGWRLRPGGPIYAAYVDGEVFEEGNWKSQRYWSDMIPLTARVAPGETVEVLTELPFHEGKGKLKARIRWGKLVSDGFVIDWESDRKAGKFDLAKAKHMQRLRALLKESGFSHDALRKDDFWQAFVTRVCKRVGTTKGFPPFHAKSIPLPEINPEGNPDFNVFSDEVSDFEYVYKLNIVVEHANATEKATAGGLSKDYYVSDDPGLRPGRKTIIIQAGYPDGIGAWLTLVHVPPTNGRLPSSSDLERLADGLAQEVQKSFPGAR